MVLAALIGIGLALVVWLAGQLSILLAGRGWSGVGPQGALRILAGLVAHPAQPASAWPLRWRAGIAGPAAFYALVAVLVAMAVASAWVVGLVFGRLSSVTRPSEGGRPGSRSAGWGRGRELRSLTVRRPSPERLSLGRCGRRLLAAEYRQSVIVVGPSQSHKTTGFAVPAILEWEGPVLATSVKTDLVRDTMGWRSHLGPVWIYDPTASSGLASSGWSPLQGASTWAGARRIASWLCGAGRMATGGPAEADFWYATAAKLLAPLLFAAACSGATMSEVVGWVDTQEVSEVAALLEALGVPEALRAAEASWGREDRQRSSVYTTAETVLEAFADPGVAASARRPEIEPEALVDGGTRTLYISAPAHEQHRLHALFASLVSSVLNAAFERATRTGRPLEPALLVVLDEAANVAPLADLDTLAATAAGHGVQLVTVWQDMAQVASRYGNRAATVVNNHRAKVVLSGISDPATLDHVSALVGDTELEMSSTTVDGRGGRSTTRSPGYRRLAPADSLRRIRPGEGVLVYGHLPPARLRLRQWYADRELARRGRW